MALFPGLPGWDGTRKAIPIWILLKQETVSGIGISWAINKSAPSSRQITMPAPHHSGFYRPDALPAAQPTASKHWWHKTETAKVLEIKGRQKMLVEKVTFDAGNVQDTTLLSVFIADIKQAVANSNGCTTLTRWLQFGFKICLVLCYWRICKCGTRSTDTSSIFHNNHIVSCTQFTTQICEWRQTVNNIIWWLISIV